MKSNKLKMSCNGGFTLIELLVVVLIIGILAAIAVPQYKKAVIKSQVVQELTAFNAYSKAMDVWLLENGWPSSTIFFTGEGRSDTDYASLDIDIGTPSAEGRANQVGNNLSLAALAMSTAASVKTLASSNVNYTDGCYTIFRRLPTNAQWSLAAIRLQTSTTNATADQCPTYQKMMCQYWATQGTGLGGTAVSQCANFGITLQADK